MKKFLLMLAAALCVASAASAQTFEKGTKKVTANIGFGGGYGAPIGLSYEQGVCDLGSDMAIGVGGYLGFSNHSEKIASIKYSHSNIFIAAMGNFHYAGVEKLDLYAGLRLGYNVASVRLSEDVPGYDTSVGGIVYTTHIGANYYLSNNWAINAELGYGISNLNVGVSYRF